MPPSRTEAASSAVAVLHGPEDVRLEQRPTPEPAAHEVLVEVRSVGVCGSDVHYYRDGRIGHFVVEEPLVLGHEASGVVVATGSDVPADRVGQRVALEPGVPCRRCGQCLAGHYNLCPHVRFFATPPVDGAFAQHVTLDADFAHPVPDSLSFDEAALLEPLSVAVWACGKAAVTTGDDVLVTGAGPVGLLCAQVARAQGAASVTVTDVAPHRLELAQRLGADHTLDVGAASLDEAGVTADVLLECSGVGPAVAPAIRVVRPAGRVVLVGMAADADLSLPVQAIQERELTLTGTFRYARTYPAAIALAASGRVDLASLVTSHVGLDGVEQALLAGRDDPSSVKPMVVPAPDPRPDPVTED